MSEKVAQVVIAPLSLLIVYAKNLIITLFVLLRISSYPPLKVDDKRKKTSWRYFLCEDADTSTAGSCYGCFILGKTTGHWKNEN